jgi:hypothetical protein
MADVPSGLSLIPTKETKKRERKKKAVLFVARCTDLENLRKHQDGKTIPKPISKYLVVCVTVFPIFVIARFFELRCF